MVQVFKTCTITANIKPRKLIPTNLFRFITMPPIENWIEMTDMDSLKLISEILDNITDSAIIQRNMNALEKRYSKPHGTISDWIFYEDICNPIEILNRLKINTSIAL